MIQTHFIWRLMRLKKLNGWRKIEKFGENIYNKCHTSIITVSREYKNIMTTCFFLIFQTNWEVPTELINGCIKENSGGQYFLVISNASNKLIPCLQKNTILHRQDVLSHYKFNKSILLSWLQKEKYWPKKQQLQQVQVSEYPF